MAALSKFAYPSDDIYTAATVSMTNEDSAYPDSNSQNQDPADTSKATGTSTVVTITTPSSQVLAYAVPNTNATSIALTNGAGMASQALTIPSRTTSGQIINGWKSTTGVANNTSTTWTLTMSKTGSAVLEFGRVALVTALRDLDWMYGVRFGRRRPGTVTNTTRGGTRYRTTMGVRQRFARGTVRRHTALALFDELEEQVNGLERGFLFVPEHTVNDAWFATIAPDSIEWARNNPNSTEFQVEIMELAMGAPPALT